MPSSECTARTAQVYAYVRWSPITPTDITGSSTAKLCQIVEYNPAALISATTISSASCNRATRSGVTSPRMRTARPGPGNGWRPRTSPRDVDVLQHAFADGYARHHDDELAKAIPRCQLIDRAQIDVGLARPRLHL